MPQTDSYGSPSGASHKRANEDHDGRSLLIAAHPPHPASQVDADTEKVFWTEIAAGLTALAHLNCWAAAKKLVEVKQSVVHPHLNALPQSTVRTLINAVTQAVSPLAGSMNDSRLVTTQSSGMRWPRYFPDAQNWLIQLVEAYKETIRAFWMLLSQDKAVTHKLELLRYRCFGLVTACDDLIHAVDRQHDIFSSWRSCSVVLPAYNEAENIGETVRRCVESLSHICPNFQVIVVNDGSSDTTGAIADQAAIEDASIEVVHNHPNKGYGGALLAGFAVAQGERIFFMDSDGQFDVSEIATLLRLVESGDCQVAIGYRAKRSDPFMRKLNAWGWKIAAHFVTGLVGIRDIDCAFKLFPTSALRSCNLIAQGASVNVEMLLKFQRTGLQISQIAVTHMPRTKGSPTGAKPQVILRAFRELFRLRRHMRKWEPLIPSLPTSTHFSAAALEAHSDA